MSGTRTAIRRPSAGGGLGRVLLRRLRDLVIVLFLVGTTLFFMLRAVPGDPAVVILGADATEEQLRVLRDSMGLTGSLWQQYAAWFGNLLQGDLGHSYTHNAPVAEVLLTHFGPTLTLALASTVISAVLAVAIATWIASRPHSRLARWAEKVLPAGLAVPNFWLALMLVWLFALQVRLVAPSGYVPLFENPVESVRLLALPVASLALGQTVQFAMVLMESMAGEQRHLYLRTARVKGLSERRIVLKHVLPNAALPVITVVGMDFAVMIGGVVIIESVFLIPGLGSVLIGAIGSRDFVLIQGGALLVAFLFVVINLLVDLVYGLVDPRVRAA